jgi:hypothetical protein
MFEIPGKVRILPPNVNQAPLQYPLQTRARSAAKTDKQAQTRSHSEHVYVISSVGFFPSRCRHYHAECGNDKIKLAEVWE